MKWDIDILIRSKGKVDYFKGMVLVMGGYLNIYGCVNVLEYNGKEIGI